MIRKAVLAAAVAFASSSMSAFNDGPTGEFTMTAQVETRSGTREMGMTIVVTSPMTRDEAKPLKKILRDRGQRGLLEAIRGGYRGSFRYGALEYPIDLVIAEPIPDGYRFFVVTGRTLDYEEIRQGKASLDNPFTAAVFDVPDFGWGEGELFTRAALSIGDDGKVQAARYKNRMGTLKEVTRQ